MSQFVSTCPHCGQQFNALTEWAGQNLSCPTCGKQFQITVPGAAPQPQTAAQDINTGESAQLQEKTFSVWDNFSLSNSKYADFSGRASRSEYWLFILIFIAVSIVLMLISLVFGVIVSGISAAASDYLEFSDIFLSRFLLIYQILSILFGGYLFVPQLAITARRLHDSNCSAWFMLLMLIPFTGWIALLLLMLRPGSDGENKFDAE